MNSLKGDDVRHKYYSIVINDVYSDFFQGRRHFFYDWKGSINDDKGND